MPRPKKSFSRQNTIERMENAFWKAMDQKPFNEITVDNILVRAEVSRTTFYYHYCNLEQLAENSIVHECMRKDMIDLIHEIVNSDTLDDVPAVKPEVLNRRFKRLELIVGPHGTLRFLELMKNCFMNIARGELGLGDKSPDMETEAALEYVVGGVVSMFEEWPRLFINWPASFPGGLFSHATSMMSKVFKELKLSLKNGSLASFWLGYGREQELNLGS